MRSDYWTLGVVGALIVCGPHLLGSGPLWSIVVLAVLSAAAWPFLPSGRHLWRSATPLAKLLVLYFAALAVWTFGQSVSVPCAWLDATAPMSVKISEWYASATASPKPSLCTISISPVQTRVELLKQLTTISAFVAATWLVSRGYRLHLVVTMAVSSLIVTLVAFLHLAFHQRRVFGIYEPRYTQFDVFGPILNPNHLAAVLGVGVALTLGLLEKVPLGRNSRQQKLSLFVLCLSMTALAVRTYSRSGILVILGTYAFFFLWILRTKGITSKRVWGVVAAIAASGVVAISMGLERFSTEVTQSNWTSKLLVAWKGLRVAWIQPWVGVGRGGFSQAFVQLYGTEIRFSHPENLVVQWLTEWGLVAGGLAVLLFVVTVALGFRRSRDAVHVFTCLATAGVVIHDLADFSMETSVIATWVAVLLAVTLHGETSRSHSALASSARSADPSSKKQDLAVRLAQSALWVGLVGALSVAVWEKDIDTLSRRASVCVASGSTRCGPVLRTSTALHKAEPEFWVLAAADALRHRPESFLPLASMAMQLAPAWYSPHVLVAQWMLRYGDSTQGLLEFRRAIELNPLHGTSMWCHWISRNPRIEWVLGAAPHHRATAIAFLTHSAECLAQNPEVASLADQQLLQLDPNNVGVRLRSARRNLAKADPHAALLDTKDALRLSPDDPVALELRVRAALGANDAVEALNAIQRGRSTADDKEFLWNQLEGAVHTLKKDAEEMRKVMNRNRGLLTEDIPALARHLHLMATYELQLGNRGHALQALTESYSISPSPSTGLMIGTLLTELGNRVQARATFQELIARFPDSPEAAAAQAKLGETTR